ncbi:hypothetical protein EXIGLDRAFT_165341 [Exidia glandulosa HHB12029]|uniref:Uncharacterized protein n=1 Tax=Exidia glandulosa HHB12029 TaxID=1314781 RepID=A0A165FDB6_EXIGL|nr:hypothetical protein EXIGLDRAFT_165341 [Exidia glandulosa HHB12029]
MRGCKPLSTVSPFQPAVSATTRGERVVFERERSVRGRAAVVEGRGGRARTAGRKQAVGRRWIGGRAAKGARAERGTMEMVGARGQGASVLFQPRTTLFNLLPDRRLAALSQVLSPPFHPSHHSTTFFQSRILVTGLLELAMSIKAFDLGLTTRQIFNSGHGLRREASHNLADVRTPMPIYQGRPCQHA